MEGKTEGGKTAGRVGGCVDRRMVVPLRKLVGTGRGLLWREEQEFIRMHVGLKFHWNFCLKVSSQWR